MKYKTKLVVLRILIYIKRFLWWLGGHLSLGIQRSLLRLWRIKGYGSYWIAYRLKKIGFVTGKDLHTKRFVIHGTMLALLLVIAWPQSRWWTVPYYGVPGQHTKLYGLVADSSDVTTYQEVSASPLFAAADSSVPWDSGALAPTVAMDTGEDRTATDVLADTVSGMAILKPITMPGAIVSGRRTSARYEVESGDSLYSIAGNFGVSISTIMWANGLTANSVLRPGNILVIPPVTGVLHTVKRGETLGRIAKLYQASSDDIASFNRLDQNGEGLRAGEEIMVPGGVLARQTERPTAQNTRSAASAVRRVAAPPSSREMAGATGFVWPSGVRVVTQGYGIRHHALDIAGPFHTPNYAANAGRVITADCPSPGEYRGPKLNHGYGCLIIVDHGNGIKTLYGHNDQILVSVGDYVERGQTIGLMGKTGNVRGVTGIHLHFEVIFNGQRVNPYGYVR